MLGPAARRGAGETVPATLLLDAPAGLGLAGVRGRVRKLGIANEWKGGWHGREHVCEGETA